MKIETSKYNESYGIKLLQSLTKKGLYLFTTDEARQTGEELNINYGSVRKILMKMEDAGWIIRLRGGLYATTGELPGNIQVHPFAIATRLVEPSAISHLSALNFHRLLEQIPIVVTATTPKNYVTPSMRKGEKQGSRHTWEVQGTSYEYVRIKPEHFFGVDQVWVDELCQVPMFDKERTILDGFVNPKLFGGMGEVLGIIEDNVRRLDLNKLVEYALRYDKDSVIKRAGWTLERIGADQEIWTPLKDVPVSSYRLLDPSGPRGGEYNKTWMIQENLWLRNNE